MTSIEAIEQFGTNDYTRLIEYKFEQILKIETIKDPELVEFSKMLLYLIEKKKICMMDKEHPIILNPSGVVGYNGKILIFAER